MKSLGAPNDHSSTGSSVEDLHFKRCAGKNTDEYLILVQNGVTIGISRQACGATPSVSAREAEAKGSYFPPDTRGETAFVTNLGEPAHRYTSSALAAAPIPRDAYHDCDFNPVPSGTFTLVVADTGWTLAAGTCP